MILLIEPVCTIPECKNIVCCIYNKETEMDKYLPIITHSPLFSGMSDSDIESMLICLQGHRRSFRKGQFIYRSGDEVCSIALVLSGGVNVVKGDYWGNENIIAAVGPGGSFAESYACSPGSKIGVSVVAAHNSDILFMDIARVTKTCPSACTFHSRLIQNLVGLLASKNLAMNEKIACLAQRSTKEKVLSYLWAESARQKNRAFDIPFNRQELADYLSVDRSALSNELSKLQREEVISFDKNHFILNSSK